MSMRTAFFSARCVVCLFVVSVAWAHFPTLSDGTANSASNALIITDPDLSQVIYHEVTAGAPQLWLQFDLSAGQSLYVELGIPLLDRLADYRPALALIGHGLPPADLPFAIPDGLGAQVFASEQTGQPEEFYERFSGTSSWVLVSETLTVPASGTYYLVAYEPAGQPGKLWAALGTREDFGPDDLPYLVEILPRIREFHEVPNANALPCFLAPGALMLTVAFFLRQRRARVL